MVYIERKAGSVTFPVITVSGAPGSGKSTLCRAIALRTGFSYLAFDDYSNITMQPINDLRSWIDRGAKFDEIFDPQFRSAILFSAETSPVIVETPFGPLHRQEGVFNVESIWLDVDADIALARVIKEEVLRSDWGSVDEMQSWCMQYLQNYQDFVRQILVKQAAQVRPLCSIVLNATMSPNDLLDEAISKLSLE